jgi:hypothetical protein
VGVAGTHVTDVRTPGSETAARSGATISVASATAWTAIEMRSVYFRIGLLTE